MADKRTIEKLDKRVEELIAERDEARKWWEYWQNKGMELEAQRDQMREALERIATEKERVPVKHKTGVSGEPRFVHEIRSRVIAENALTDRFSFDLSELPEDAVITGATLILNVEDVVAERDRLREASGATIRKMGEALDRSQQKERDLAARVSELEAALRDIARSAGFTRNHDIARAALDKETNVS